MKEELKEKDVVLSNIQNQIDSIKDYHRNHHGSYVRSEYMGQGMPTLVDPSMLSHTMASMGPVSSTMYRPRPQLPNSGPSSSHPQHRRSFPP